MPDVRHVCACADPESFLEGVQLFFFFFFFFFLTIIGPLAFCWRADDGPTLNAGLVDL